MNLPNFLTLSRIALIPFIVSLIYLNQLFWAAILFAFASLLDAVDGYLARKLNQVTDFGKLMDPIADKILVISILIMLVERGLAQSIPVIIICAREFIISGWRSHKATAGNIISASICGKTKTILQMAAVLMLLLNYPFAGEVLWLAAIVSVYSGVEYIGRS